MKILCLLAKCFFVRTLHVACLDGTTNVIAAVVSPYSVLDPLQLLRRLIIVVVVVAVIAPSSSTLARCPQPLLNKLLLLLLLLLLLILLLSLRGAGQGS